MIYIFSGNIGVGKTSLAKMLSKKYSIPLVYFDDIVCSIYENIYDDKDGYLLTSEQTESVYNKMLILAKDIIENGQDVILESMYMEKNLQIVIQFALNLNTDYMVIRVECDEDIVQQRLQIRKERSPNTASFSLHLMYKSSFMFRTFREIIIDNTSNNIERNFNELIAILKRETAHNKM